MRFAFISKNNLKVSKHFQSAVKDSGKMPLVYQSKGRKNNYPTRGYDCQSTIVPGIL